MTNTDRKNCLDCGAGNISDANFCILCGSDFSTQTVKENAVSVQNSTNCKSCGVPILSDAKFCHNCGQSVSGSKISGMEKPAKSDKKTTLTTERGNWLPVGLTLLGFIAVGFFLTSLAVNENDEVVTAPKAKEETNAPGHNHPTMTADAETLKKIDELTALLGNAKNAAEKKKISDELAGIYVGLGRYKDAADLFIAYLPNDPKNEKLNLAIANLLDDAGEKTKSVEYYKKALEINPKNVDARVDYATVLIQTEAPMVAITELNKALELDPNHQIANLNLGIMNYTIGRYEKAKEFFLKAKNLNPSSPAGLKAAEGLSAIESINNKTTN